MADEEITVGTVNDGPDTGEDVTLPVLDMLTGRGFVTGKSGSGKSVLEGTPVYTENGRKPIEEIEQGENVLSLNKQTYEQEFREVQAAIEHQSSDLLKITLDDGTEIVGTKDHSFLTVDFLEIVPILGDDIEEGTWIPLSRRLPSVVTHTEIDLAEYTSSANNIQIREREIQSGSKCDPRYLDLDFRTGMVLGLYLAEGSFDSSLPVQIAATDENVKGFLSDNGFNIYERTCNKSFRPFGEFVKAEFRRGSESKRLPDWVFNTPKAFKSGILSGYFDGDGTVAESSVTATSKSPELLAGIRELLKQFGISSTVRDKLVLYDDNELTFKRLTVDAFSVNRFDDMVELNIETKQRRLRELCERLEEGDRFNSKDLVPNFGSILNFAARERGCTKRDSENRSKAASLHNLTRKQKAGRETFNRILDELDVEGRAKQFGKSDIQWKRVVSVEELDGEHTVYDLDVECNDNFVANGAFVHNSNSASVIAENLLDRGYALLVVDIDGEYYGLKEKYEILHVGGDEECDILVGPEHAEKIATLALENNIPIILDVSSYLDEGKAAELLTEVAKQLFAKEKKLKKPFLLIIEEVHEYIPEGGGLDECGRMLIKIGKRGRKHGLGITGISQRPADVKKDFITQCDWLCWHRLTWKNDTQVVRRVLDAEYAEAVESLDDGEAFVRSDWAEDVHRVQFDRKQTFDAGATPGLDDFERPDLKSVSSDLVSELEQISEAENRREEEIERLRRELTEKEKRIEKLERDLEDARDLSQMADQFATALFDHTGRSRSQLEFEQQTLDEYPEMPFPNLNSVDTDTSGNGETNDDQSKNEVSDEIETSQTQHEQVECEKRKEEERKKEPNEEGKEEVEEREGKCDENREHEEQDENTFDQSIVEHLRNEITSLDSETREMLACYRVDGPLSPMDAYTRAGGSGDRMKAYWRNSTLRRADLITHAGRGQYAYALSDLITDYHDEQLTPEDVEKCVARIEDSLISEL